MSSEDHPEDAPQAQDTHLPTGPAAMATGNKKRPRLDLNIEGGREHKRGKSMFGLVLGTLNKAKIEDKERNASEAAKKRQLIEQRLQSKLRKETDSVRRAEEAKKDKTTANRKEEELQLKDSIYKLRRTRLPLLSNFLLTSDNISSDDTSLPSKNILTFPPRSHPPPLYYLPAILTPAQEEFLARRKAEVQEAVQKEWSAFRDERNTILEEIKNLRQRVIDEEARKQTERDLVKQQSGPTDADAGAAAAATVIATTADQDVDMDTDSQLREREPEPEGEMDIDTGSRNDSHGNNVKDNNRDTLEAERKEEPTAMQGDDDDVVEY